MTTQTTIDFAAILSGAAYPNGGRDGTGRGMATIDAILAARVPELCPDCEGSGEVESSATNAGHAFIGDVCTHPNAPTIGQMLREWQALTALAQYAWHEVNCAAEMMRLNRHDTCTCGLDAARAALEAVRGD